MVALGVVNAAFAAVSVAFAVVAVVRPAVLSRSGTPASGERFYAWMYAARAVPLGFLAAIVPFAAPGPAGVLGLLAAACAQVADAGIGVSRREWGMAGGGAVLALVHAVTAVAIW
ncbi:hypothetical protein [Amycolatopsis anabasis]|uniref:hypothetical protein n=1 Tax=Amycolatopsis anabasis TaxID=1840409 RepID=UPI00131B71F8|nr:hypothetical protein [Amycolatopsis anabasis]